MWLLLSVCSPQHLALALPLLRDVFQPRVAATNPVRSGICLSHFSRIFTSYPLCVCFVERFQSLWSPIEGRSGKGRHQHGANDARHARWAARHGWQRSSSTGLAGALSVGSGGRPGQSANTRQPAIRCSCGRSAAVRRGTFLFLIFYFIVFLCLSSNLVTYTFLSGWSDIGSQTCGLVHGHYSLLVVSFRTSFALPPRISSRLSCHWRRLSVGRCVR